MAASLPSTQTIVTLAQRPQAEIVPGETFATNTAAPVPKLDELGDGQLLVKALYLSLDPAMRGWLNDTRSYIPPVQIGEVMRGASVCQVLTSKSQKFPAGQLVVTNNCGWQEYGIVADKHCTTVEDTGESTTRSAIDALSVLGLTGLTAYFGITRIGEVKAGDFVVVSGAAGATGSIVGQIAKLKGARVLGIAGGASKCAWLTNELGFDQALDYKSPTFARDFRAATKDLIDIYFDNVGGDILDLALSRAKPHARFVMCGGISQYNSKEQKGPKNYLMIVSMRIRMQGFIVFDFEREYPAARRELALWIKEGKIKRTETVVRGGLQKAEGALVDLFRGGNTGKMLVEVARLDTDQAKL